MAVTAKGSSQKIGRVLLVDDEPDNLRILMSLLTQANIEALTVISGEMALDAVHKTHPDLILLDVVLPDLNGYEVCRRLKSDPRTAEIPIIFISGLGKSIDKLQAFSAGGIDYICKPFNTEEVLARVKTHLDLRYALKALQLKNEELEREKSEREKTEQELVKCQHHVAGILSGQLLNPKAFKNIITGSDKIHGLFQFIEALACSSEPVLIQGESGVGKELFAKAVYNVCTPGGPWVAVNIAGYDDNVFSDTLFGHEKGAFTDAGQKRSGMIESATNGTLFLDEIGDLSPASQIKLLRLLQEKEYFPLGSDEPRQAHCRIVLATNVDLRKKVEDGSFRRDLYFRLLTHPIVIPSLRDRKKDIPLLLDHFLEAAAKDLNKKKPSYPAELQLLLRNYSFPGNVRELRAMVFNAMSRHKNHILSMSSFTEAIDRIEYNSLKADEQISPKTIMYPQKLPTLKESSDLLVEEALRRTEGNQSMAAKLLGVTPSALNVRLKKKKAS